MFFDRFNKAEYDFLGDGSRHVITDLFKYIDVVAEGDDLFAYQNVDILNGERPDVLSQRLYGTPDYAWTFFIVNEDLKRGRTAWPKSQREYDEWLDYVYGDYGVISFPRRKTTDGNPGSTRQNTLTGLSFDDSRWSDNLYLVAKDADTEDYAVIKIVDWDPNMYQLWVDKTEQYAFKAPIIGTDVPTDNLALWYPLATNTDVDSENDSGTVSDWAPDSTFDGDSIGEETGTLDSDYSHPTWDADESAWFFDGVNDRITINELSSANYSVSQYDLPTILPDTQDWTIAFWFKSDMGSSDESENGVIVGGTSPTSAAAWSISIVDGKFSLVAALDDSELGTYPELGTLYQSSSSINDSKWHHCAVVNDGDSRRISMYVDGIKEINNVEAYADILRLFDIFTLSDTDYFLTMKVEYLMYGDFDAIDSDDSSPDESEVNGSYTRGYLKDFRIYLKNIDSETIKDFVKLDFDLDSDNESTSNQSFFFGWDKEANHTQPYEYHIRPIGLVDSDDSDWNDEIATLQTSFNAVPTSSVADRPETYLFKAYDYWENAKDAPHHYYPMVNIQSNAHPGGLPLINSGELTDESDNSDPDQWIFFDHQTYKGWIYGYTVTPTVDGEYLPAEENPKWPLSIYTPQVIMGDNTIRQFYFNNDELAVPSFFFGVKAIKVVTEDDPVQVNITGQAYANDEYQITIDTVEGYRYVLFRSDSLSGPWKDDTTAKHLLGDGTSQTFYAHSNWPVIDPSTNYFRVYRYKSTIEFSRDTDKIISARDALLANRFALWVDPNNSKKDGWATFRSPYYVSYKEAHDNEQENRRTIRVVRPESIEEFAATYSKIIQQ